MKKSLLMFLAIGTMATTTQSCKKKIYGCTDNLADNYSSVATEDDESCIYLSPSMTTTELTFYTFDFSGSGGYYTAPFSITNIDENDAVFFEWKCGTCGAFEVIPKTLDDFIMVAVTRSGSSFSLENSIYDGSTITTPPYSDYFSGQTLKMYIIYQDALIANEIDKDDLKAISEYVHSNI